MLGWVLATKLQSDKGQWKLVGFLNTHEETISKSTQVKHNYIMMGKKIIAEDIWRRKQKLQR